MGLLTALTARPIHLPNHPVVRRTLQNDPWASCLVAARFEREGGGETGGQLWGIAGGRLGLCLFGGNLIPVSGDARAMRAFAAVAATRPRFAASITGRAELVLPLWEHLGVQWGPSRLVREDQPLMICPQPPLVEPDPLVRYTHPEDLDRYEPAAIAMFTEELQIDPRTDRDGRAYRNRLAGVIAAGRSFVRMEGSEVVFKAEIGAVSADAAMIQGVWVHPDLRGRGIGTAAVAAVVQAIQQGLGRTPVLYVNTFNAAARTVYERVGFRQVGTFASVLF